jgi:hypothetical protein
MTKGPKFHELLLQGAKALGSDVTPAPTEWTGPALNTEVLRSPFRASHCSFGFRTVAWRRAWSRWRAFLG